VAAFGHFCPCWAATVVITGCPRLAGFRRDQGGASRVLADTARAGPGTLWLGRRGDT